MMIGYCAHLIAEQIKQVCRSGKHLLLIGERGTGKELAAKVASESRGMQLFSTNCAILPDLLRQSILFGHKKGAFTGATEDKPGLFKEANNQSVFLDELDKAPPEIRYSLLRYLTNNKIEPVGGKEEEVNVWVIAACQDESKIEPDILDRFPERVYLPPLRDRITLFAKNGLEIDILHLAKYFLLNHPMPSEKLYDCIKITILEQWLLNPWEGNIRELQKDVWQIDREPDNLLKIDKVHQIPVGYFLVEKIPEYRPPWLNDLQYSEEEKQVRKMIENWTIHRKPKAKETAEILKKFDPLTRKLEYARENVRSHPLSSILKPSRPKYDKLEDIERDHIQWVLQDSGGNKKKTAERLGISEKTLHEKITRYGWRE